MSIVTFNQPISVHVLLQFQKSQEFVSNMDSAGGQLRLRLSKFIPLNLLEGLAQSSLWWVLTAGKKGGWLMLTTAILAWGLQGSAWGPRMVLHGIARRCKAAHGAQRQITDNLHRSNPLTQATPHPYIFTQWRKVKQMQPV